MLTKIKVKLTKTEAGHTMTGLGFYQIEEDALYFQIGQQNQTTRFFSYLESDRVRLDIAKDGTLLFIEISLPRRQWEIDEQLKLPQKSDQMSLRFLDFRSQIKRPQIVTNSDNSFVRIDFNPTKTDNWISLAPNIYAAIGEGNSLNSILLSNIVDDRAGVEMIAFRKKLHKTDSDK